MGFQIDVPDNASPYAVMRAIAEQDPSRSRRWEVVGDQLYALPSPVDRHGGAQLEIGRILSNVYRQSPGHPDEGWIFRIVPDLKDVPDSEGVRRPKIPDLAGWRASRYRVNDAGYCPVAPDWICEILSPATAEKDRGPKALDYALLGLRWYWLVDLDVAELEVRRLEEGALVTHGRYDLTESFAADPFQEARFEPGDWFGLLA